MIAGLGPSLQLLIKRAQKVEMTGAEREAQRRSFAYGNTKIENSRITREHIDRAADKITTRVPGRAGEKTEGDR